MAGGAETEVHRYGCCLVRCVRTKNDGAVGMNAWAGRSRGSLAVACHGSESVYDAPVLGALVGCSANGRAEQRMRDRVVGGTSVRGGWNCVTGCPCCSVDHHLASAESRHQDRHRCRFLLLHYLLRSCCAAAAAETTQGSSAAIQPPFSTANSAPRLPAPAARSLAPS